MVVLEGPDERFEAYPRRVVVRKACDGREERKVVERSVEVAVVGVKRMALRRVLAAEAIVIGSLGYSIQKAVVDM